MAPACRGRALWGRAAMLVLLLAWNAAPVSTFSWGSDRGRQRNRDYFDTAVSPADALLKGSPQLSGVYAVALTELKELESEPFCHRIAARLLVNNCQLLDGKDEATVLTDSGRKVRDFVDSYAASLAICDLERGNFQIPRECAKFRESELSKLPAGHEAYLHVTSKEIDRCLTGLGTSDSAWNTWVSYRHKALRFCEAARADNEKAQSILLYEKLVEVMAKLTDGVEAEMKARMAHIDTRTLQTFDHLDRLNPKIDELRLKLSRMEEQFTRDIGDVVTKSAEAAQWTFENVTTLQRMVRVMLDMMLETSAELASSHEKAVETFNEKANYELINFMGAMVIVSESASSLHAQLESSQARALELENRHDALEKNLGRLESMGSHLSSNYDSHNLLLTAAQNLTDDILDTLLEAAGSAQTVNNSLLGQTGSGHWLPFIVCPVASLVMGSYGLPPSALRNLGLIAIGEFAGYLVSNIGYYQNSGGVLYSSLFNYVRENVNATVSSSLELNDNIEI